jgi:hypothetical protein
MFDLLWMPSNTSVKDILCLEDNEAADLIPTLSINQSLVDWLNGKLDTGTLTDILLEYDVDPAILDDCESYVQFLLR